MPSCTGTTPALEWALGLPEQGQVQLESTCAVAEARLGSGQDLHTLASPIPESGMGLWRLLLALPGYRGHRPSLIFFWPTAMLWWGVAGLPSARISERQVRGWDAYVVDWMRRQRHDKTSH